MEEEAPAEFGRAHKEEVVEWLISGAQQPNILEDFKLHLLLGAPRNEKLLPAFARAKNILRKMPVQHDVIGEENAAAFADLIAKDLMDHSEACHP